MRSSHRLIGKSLKHLRLAEIETKGNTTPMKPQIATIAALLAMMATSFAAAAEDGKHLFILSGQSNMEHLPPKISFTPAVEAAFGKDNVIVVKEAESGQPILRWYKLWKPAKGEPPKATGDLYDRLMTNVNAAIQGQKLASVTFIWMQGERDAKTGQAAVYEASLKGLIAQLRTDIKRRGVNFVIGRLSDCQMQNTDWVLLRKAQVAVAEADPRGAWVDTDDLNDKTDKEGKRINDLHYSREGYRLLGERFAKQAIELIKKQSRNRLDK